MKRKPGIGLVERALIEQRWRNTAIQAEIQAVMSDDSNRMVHAAGSVLFVVLGACRAEEADLDSPALPSLYDGVEAVHDQAEEPVIVAERRARIIAALETCAFLIPLFDRKSLVDSACELALKLRRQDIRRSDFEPFMKRGAEA